MKTTQMELFTRRTDFKRKLPSLPYEEEMDRAKKQLVETNRLVYDLARQKTAWLTGEMYGEEHDK
jgi:hypothetical protein